ncbi:hypothetical protein ACH436_00095 [Isoptericola sp. NPDC019693]|uniref:hypothetical protein n=1 Tax=Isoptericola sp. NPDC019693 TaxID=3364009 RepID=UPI00378953E5
MREIRAALQAVQTARQQLDAAVRKARAQGHTWAEIGAEMGMSRQAAFKRFGRPTDPRSGEEIRGRGTDEVVALTDRVFALVAAGQHEELAGLMEPRTAEELTPDVVGAAWRSVLAEVGGLDRCRGTQVELPDGSVVADGEQVLGTVIGTTTLVCEAGEVLGRVAFDDASRVVGLLIVPTDHGPLPF